MKTNRLFQTIRTPAVSALALILATATVSSAVSARATSKTVKRGQIHFEYAMPQETQQDKGWYQPARSPQFSAYLH